MTLISVIRNFCYPGHSRSIWSLPATFSWPHTLWLFLMGLS